MKGVKGLGAKSINIPSFLQEKTEAWRIQEHHHWLTIVIGLTFIHHRLPPNEIVRLPLDHCPIAVAGLLLDHWTAIRFSQYNTSRSLLLHFYHLLSLDHHPFTLTKLLFFQRHRIIVSFIRLQPSNLHHWANVNLPHQFKHLLPALCVCIYMYYFSS